MSPLLQHVVCVWSIGIVELVPLWQLGRYSRDPSRACSKAPVDRLGPFLAFQEHGILLIEISALQLTWGTLFGNYNLICPLAGQIPMFSFVVSFGAEEFWQQPLQCGVLVIRSCTMGFIYE